MIITSFNELILEHQALFALLIPVPLFVAFFVPSRVANSMGKKMGSIILTLSGLSFLFAVISTLFLSSSTDALYKGFPLLGPIALTTYFDAVSAIMVLLVSFLTIAVVSFSKNYLSGNPNQGEFFKWISITAGSVLLLAISGNLVIFVFAWIFISFSLHRLLAFYGQRRGAQLAAREKFIFTRLGDLALLIALGMIWHQFGTFDYKKLIAIHMEVSPGSTGLIGIFLVLAAVIKSAQFPFHGWLPDTMEAPTPVSALMHAGIINAGGFLVIRFSSLIALSPHALQMLISIGGCTALFGSLVMITQTSVKRSLAFSTIAQMGFMMFQCGLGAFALALLHIVVHSLYKAYAFLCSGNVVSKFFQLGSYPKKKHLGFYGMLVLLMASATLLFLVSLTGIPILDNPLQFALAFILMIALAQLLWSWGALTRGWRAFMGGLLASILICSLYFFIHIKIESLLGGILLSEWHSTLGWPEVIVTVFAFLLLALRPFFPAIFASTPLGRMLFVHAYNGFYISTIVHRLLSEIRVSFFQVFSKEL